MKTALRIFLQGMVCLLLSNHIFAQTLAFTLPDSNAISPPVQSLTVQNGLPQGFVTGIIQDKQGFIWMGTKGGLVRYDGYRTKIFKNDPGNNNTLASNDIQALYLDRQDNLWIIYAGHSVDVFDPVTETVKHVSREPGLSWLARSAYLQPAGLFADTRGRYWFISPDLQKLNYFTWQHKAPVPVTVPDGERVIAIQEDRRGKIWICTDKALYTFQNSNQHLHIVAPLPTGIIYKDYRMTQMVPDEKGNWLIGNWGCVLLFTPGGQWKVIPTPFPAKPTRFVVKAPDGKIYINAGNQVFRVSKNYTLPVAWTNTEIPGDLESLMIDRSNVMWAGTNTFGARSLNLSSSGFHSYTYRYGFIFDALHALHYPAKKIPYQDGGELSYLARYARDRQGNLWFIHLNAPNNLAAPPGYLPVYKLAKNGRASVVLIKTNSRQLLQIAFDQHNQCWVIVFDKDSLYGLLAKANLDNGTLTPTLHLKYIFNKISYLTVFQNKLCIVYNDALQLYDPQTQKSVFYENKGKFGNAGLLMAVPDPKNDSILWITTLGNGLIRFNMDNGKTKTWTEKEGIPSNTVYAAIPDNHGYLWCSSNNGIFRFNPVTDKVLSFTAEDGLQGNEFNRYHFLETPDGHIIFGGTRGWTVFDPGAVHIDTSRPPVVITDILVKNEPLGRLAKWKDSIVNNLHSLMLSYDQNFITFTFAGLEFNNSSQIHYRYKLEGLDKDWIYAGTEHTANYTSLPPGKYLFKVNAGNTSGRWSDHIKTLQVTIFPPWWKTWWAYLTEAFMIITLAYAFYRYRIYRLHIRHQLILQQKEAEHLKTMDEMKTRFFSNITHEFRTPLSLIIAPLEQINKDKGVTPALKKKMSVIHRNAQQLLHLINQLLDMSKMDAGNMKVFLSRGDLSLFVQGIIKDFEGRSSAKNIELHFESNLQEEYNFDADKWQKIVSNLLSNAVKFTPENGHITVRLITGDPLAGPAGEQPVTGRPAGQADNLPSAKQNILLEVRDSGIGIPADKISYLFKRFYQADNSSTRLYSGTGIGLALTKDLTELMDGNISVESKPQNGSVFRVIIPAGKTWNEHIPLLSHVQPSAENRLLERMAPDEDEIKSGENAPLILIVEDNGDLNSFLAGMLKKKYRVQTAANGKEGWQAAKENLPDIIISDIMMPQMDGYALCEKIKQNMATNHIAVILLSSRSSHDSLMKGLKHFADDYMAKPFHPEELLLRIHNLLDRQQKLRNYYKDQLAGNDEKADVIIANDPFLTRLYEVIEEHLDEKALNVEMLAEKMSMGRRTLNRKLEMVAGISANKVIRQYRLKKATSLLISGCNVSEAAYQTGFETPSYFSMAFKDFYGIPPSEYHG